MVRRWPGRSARSAGRGYFAGVKRRLLILAACLTLACGGEGDGIVSLPASSGDITTRDDAPPVAVNANSPVVYPAALAREGIEGTVLLRITVDSTGRVLPDSIAIAESSGYPALDSAAVAGASGLRFAPALRRGSPVSASFIQPVHFRNPAVPERP